MKLNVFVCFSLPLLFPCISENMAPNSKMKKTKTKHFIETIQAYRQIFIFTADLVSGCELTVQMGSRCRSSHPQTSGAFIQWETSPQLAGGGKPGAEPGNLPTVTPSSGSTNPAHPHPRTPRPGTSLRVSIAAKIILSVSSELDEMKSQHNHTLYLLFYSRPYSQIKYVLNIFWNIHASELQRA